MLTGLDPHSTYMDPDAFKDMQASTQSLAALVLYRRWLGKSHFTD